MSENPCLQQNLKGHQKSVNSIKFHNDNKQLLSCSDDNTVMKWNYVEKDVRCYKFSGHTGPVTCIDCSPNGKLIASSSCDKTVKLWVPTLRGTSTDFKAHTASVRSVEFSPDNKQLVTGSNDKSIKVWDVERRKFINSFAGHTNWVRSARYTSDGNIIASCADDKTLRIWDAKNKLSIHVFVMPKGNGTHLAVHNNGNSVAIAMGSGSVRVYDIRAQKLQQHYILHDKTTAVCWHPSGSHLLTSGADGTMRILDVMEGRPIYTLQGIGGAILAIDFSSNGDYFACAGADKNLMVWKTNFISNADDFSPDSMKICD